MDPLIFLPKSVRNRISPAFMRYGFMAIAVVIIELTIFWLINSKLGWHYLIATWVSLACGIILNWIGSRYYVFGSSHHPPHKEFGLVVFTSLAGAVLQSGAVIFTVAGLHAPALLGKIVAIIVTFFWNYTIRSRYIYKTPKIL
jgi:putative flippase GtrA